MTNLNFASYARAIKKGMVKTTNLQVCTLLLELITSDENVLNKDNNPYYISDDYVHKWLKNKRDIPSTIKEGATCSKVISKAPNYFEENIMTALSPQKEEDTYAALVELIRNDRLYLRI